MLPLQAIAMGLVVVALQVEVLGLDVLPDPVGWLLVLIGSARLPADLERLATIRALAGIALLVSAALWLPAVADSLADLHPSVAWVADLPRLAFGVVLCDSLARRALAHRDHVAAGWLRTTMTGFVVSALLPVLVFGGGVASLELAAFAVATLVLLMLVWQLFTYARRPFARADAPAPAA